MFRYLRRQKKVLSFFLIFAAFSAVAIFASGELLHEALHDHDECEEDFCPIYQALAHSSFTLFLASCFITFSKSDWHFIPHKKCYISNNWFTYHHLRSPPRK